MVEAAAGRCGGQGRRGSGEARRYAGAARRGCRGSSSPARAGCPRLAPPTSTPATLSLVRARTHSLATISVGFLLTNSTAAPLRHL